MKDKRYLANGFTLVEVAVASLISAMILTGVYTLLGSGVRSYDRISASVEEVGSTQSAIQILQRDLDSIVLDLPISLGEGDSGTGWDLAKGLYQEWSSDVGYGALFPEEDESWAPNDRLGFFISLPDDLTAQYEGKDIAHVLYFTALTQNKLSEDLKRPDDLEVFGVSRKLYRLYTPPDRVYERLVRLNPDSSNFQGVAAIPRGVNLRNGEPDDRGWYEREPSESVVSLLIGGIAQFEVQLGFILEDTVTGESGEVFRSFANEVDSLFALSLDEFNGVEMHEVLNSKVRFSVENIVPVGLSFSLKVCPPEFIGSLRGSDWNEAVGLNSQYLGRDSILPTAITYTRSLVK